MKVESISDNLTIREFTASKQVKLFSSLHQAQISGRLSFINPQQGSEWHLYLYLGSIVYATGGTHPIRRWQRNLISNLPQIPFDLSQLHKELIEAETDTRDNIWEYEQLSSWAQQEIITPKQAKNAILFILVEILFDITQGRQVLCRIDRDKILSPKLDLIEPEELIDRTQQNWQEWKNSGIADRSANLAPIVLQPEQLQEKTSLTAYQSLCKLLNGNRTLRDLAVQLRTSPLQVTTSLLPYIDSGVFSLVDVSDLLKIVAPTKTNVALRTDRPLIACVDDSVMVCRTIEQIVEIAGYRFLSIEDSTKAVDTLLKNQPDLVFLDVVMPKLNGYDLCAQLRQYEEFQDTPIVFLTSNNGLIDRIRAKIVGSSDFMKKTVDADELLHKIVQYLP